MAGLEIFFVIACIFQAVEAGSINNNPGVVTIHENYDDLHTIWTVDSTCYVRYTYKYTCYATSYYDCGDSYCSTYYSYDCYSHAWKNVVCNVCIILKDDSGHFTTSGTTVQKLECADKYCGPTCSSSGCLNGGRSHDIDLYCYRTGYETTDNVPASFTVSVTNATGPTFSFAQSAYIEISHDSVGVGSVINTIEPITKDSSDDYDQPRYRQSRAPGVSYLHQTADLFALNTSTGEIKVMKSLEYEFDYFFDMEVCVYDRRKREICHQLDIKLWACFQTPNCTSQEEWSLHDTYGTYTKHGGSSDLVFSQIYPQPTGHFASDFSSTWHTLTWTFDWNEFPELDIGYYSGDLFVTRNISIWPAWPTKDYRARVRVANSESCYNTTCDFFVRVHYTNWPIEIRSLPNVPQYFQNEDDDDGYLLHNLVVYDYNYESEDNMTCYIHRISPHEDNLFRLDHDGRYKWNSYTFYKEVCQNLDCGYKHPLPSEFQHSAWQRFYCDTDIGCLTYNRTQQYTVTIKCDDAYNTTDEKDFTFNVIKNQVPSYRHLPTLVDLNKHRVSKYDIIFEIMYWDNENEDLIYEYTYEDVKNPGYDPEYFLGSERGNYWDNLGNITMIEYLWDKDSNESYRIHICGHERRNEICEDLIVNVQEYCSETPTCRDSSISVDTKTEADYTLFDMPSLVNPSQTETFDNLDYSIKAPHGNLFRLDSSGKIVSARTFPEVYPSATYTIVGYVYNTGACGTGTCQLTVNVDFVNHPISITNVAGTTVSIHEDETSVKTLFTVSVSDNNTVDSYTCNLTSTNNGPFYLDRTPPTTGLYYLKNRQNYALTSDPAVYYINITCYDQYNSSDTFTLEIDIEPNQAPQFDNSTDWTTKNVYIEKAEKGDLVFWISASDKENDDIEWTCTVEANINPLACTSYPTYIKIYLRRGVTMEFDDGRTSDVTVCIADDKHPSSSEPSLCRTLSVSFSSTLTAPWIGNTNDWPLTMTEDTDISTVLWTADVQNPDTGESTVVIMNVYPDTYSNYFKFNQDTKELLLAKQVDYEQIQKIRFEFAVTDTHLMGLQNYTTFLNITNVNEGNTLTAKNIEISFPEDTAPNSVLPDLGLACTDIDGDDVTLSIIEEFNYTGYFSLNSNTGELVLLKEWDLESGITSETSIVIQCSDPDGETSTVVIDITVTDVNEFEPICSIYFIAETPLVISPHTSLSKVLLTIVCTDPDRDADGSFSVAPLGLGFASRYFRMLLRKGRKRSTGSTFIDVKLKDTIDLSNDKSFEATFMISDAAGNPLFTGISIEVNFTSADPDAKSKESARSLTSTKEGKVIIGVLVVEGVVIVLFIIHACCSMMCHKSKVLRFKDFDVSKNKRFKSPRKERNSRGNKTNINQTPFMTQSSVHVHQTNTTSPKTERKEVSSSDSSSGNDSDDYEQQNRREVSNIKFPAGMEVKNLGTGLQPSKYSSGPTVQARGRHTQVSQQASGLPLPVYSSTVNYHHESFRGFNQ